MSFENVMKLVDLGFTVDEIRSLLNNLDNTATTTPAASTTTTPAASTTTSPADSTTTSPADSTTTSPAAPMTTTPAASTLENLTSSIQSLITAIYAREIENASQPTAMTAEQITASIINPWEGN